ncbi:MAG: hypothetical protein ABSH09_01890 [Bryobacteraceae bacterium]|jgi:flagellar biosynthesis protein FlhF
MRIKSYYKNSVAAAIREAADELGPEAMLIESRPANAGSRHLGRMEVVFGVMEQGRENRQENPEKSAPETSGRDDLAVELQMLRSQLNDLKKIMQPAPAPTDDSSEVEELLRELVAFGMDPLVVDNLVDTAEEIWRGPLAPTLPSGARHPLRQVVSECLRRKLQVSPALNSSGRGNAAVFVGPPGVGKSTVIAKLAVQQCLSQRRTVRIVSIDTDRVGGHERLRMYAGIMGIGFTAANSFAELRDALHETRGKDYALLDTPGFSAGDSAAANDLAAALEGIDGREVHLVLPASMKCADLATCSDFYSVFKPGRLLFTKLDETASVGSIVSEALRLGKPLSFFSTGQGVPEDLEDARVETLSERLFAGEAALVASAA